MLSESQQIEIVNPFQGVRFAVNSSRLPEASTYYRIPTYCPKALAVKAINRIRASLGEKPVPKTQLDAVTEAFHWTSSSTNDSLSWWSWSSEKIFASAMDLETVPEPIMKEWVLRTAVSWFTSTRQGRYLGTVDFCKAQKVLTAFG